VLTHHVHAALGRANDSVTAYIIQKNINFDAAPASQHCRYISISVRIIVNKLLLTTV
jgi:hypothetical protein